jgi:hypothetical protein
MLLRLSHCSLAILDVPEIMNVDQSSLSLSRPTTSSQHEQHRRQDEAYVEHLTEHYVPESYHHSSYEYLSSGNGGGNNPQFTSPTVLSTHHRTSSPPQKHPNKQLISTSYSPTSYHYQPASVLDEPSPIVAYPIQRSVQPPVSTTSLSAYVPQHTNINRHSLLPTTTSDDSGNESSVNYQQQSTANHTHFVVVAIDFGTTFSGYAFAFTRDIDSILMMRKVDGNDPGSFDCFNSCFRPTHTDISIDVYMFVCVCVYVYMYRCN